MFENLDTFLNNDTIFFVAPCGNGKTFCLKKIIAYLQTAKYKSIPNSQIFKYFIYIAPGRQLTYQTFQILQDISEDKKNFGFEFHQNSIDSIYYADRKGSINLDEFENVLIEKCSKSKLLEVKQGSVNKSVSTKTLPKSRVKKSYNVGPEEMGKPNL